MKIVTDLWANKIDDEIFEVSEKIRDSMEHAVRSYIVDFNKFRDRQIMRLPSTESLIEYRNYINTELKRRRQNDKYNSRKI